MHTVALTVARGMVLSAGSPVRSQMALCLRVRIPGAVPAPYAWVGVGIHGAGAGRGIIGMAMAAHAAQLVNYKLAYNNYKQFK